MNNIKYTIFKKSALLFLLSVFASTLVTCKKYPDGPWLSLKSKEKRLSGSWSLISFYADNINLSDSLLNDTCFGPNLKTPFIFYLKPFGLDDISAGPCPAPRMGWSFIKNKKFIKITITYTSSTVGLYKTIGPYRAPLSEWRILKLTNHDLWMECKWEDGKTYTFKLKNLFPNED